MNRNSINLSKVKFLVLDEADRMWDMGFKDDVGEIVRACPKNRQTLLFSATISGELADFSGKYMKSPVEISVENYVDPTKLKQVYYDVRDDEKFSLLVHLLNNEKAHLVMIFCNTRRNADFVSKNLREQKISAQVIHGGMTQNRRNVVLKNFDNSKVNVLVCTDVAARGLDIKGVSHVYNYDLPADARDYVHRIGRTARAGAEGIAINILASRDYDNFSGVQRQNRGMIIERENTPRFEKVYVKMDRTERNFGGRGGFGNRSGGRRDFGRGRQDRRPAQRSNDGRSGRDDRRSSGERRHFSRNSESRTSSRIRSY
jgi:ATP-dependent RNA helicase DeaD